MPKDSYRIGSKVYDILIEPFLVKIKRLTVKILLKRFNKPPDVRFLEVACGTGTLSHLLSKRGYNVFALDKSYNMIRHTHDKIDDSCNGSATAIQGDASTMPFYSASFDAVIIQLGLHE
ncbi:MAG: class I SAM-dependent methyltransferase, partial [Desulfobacterales bacterium]|nr:class I SAM-dependent methyltransferase [Desulfobacterales bacterium]